MIFSKSFLFTRFLQPLLWRRSTLLYLEVLL
nr:MAG TPA: hypothetical protein [Caudoviricetes sp.]